MIGSSKLKKQLNMNDKKAAANAQCEQDGLQ